MATVLGTPRTLNTRRMLETPRPLDTPWTLAGITPALPPRADGPVATTAASLGEAASTTRAELVTPWAAADVQLPARATALPWLATGVILPSPRPSADQLV